MRQRNALETSLPSLILTSLIPRTIQKKNYLQIDSFHNSHQSQLDVGINKKIMNSNSHPQIKEIPSIKKIEIFYE